MKRLLVCLLLLAAAVPLAAQKKDAAKSAAPKVHSEMLVSTAWLAQHANDPDVVVLHVGGSQADYDAGHIPGARWLENKAFIKNDPKAPPTELPAIEDLKKSFEALGISDNTRVILYANDWQPTAARAYFTLDYIGHGDKTALLNGGKEMWMKENRALSKEKPTDAKPGTLTVTAHPEVVMLQEQVSKLGDDTVLVDSRPLARYRAGHIPNAAPLFWEKTLVSDEEPVLLAPDALRKKLSSVGVTPEKKVVTYCEVGYQASWNYFVAKYLGMDAKHYDGAWSEWSNAKQPSVIGDSRK
jgi:thiosulfate/3-mercaptopyruvate sulfurtransferase